MHRLLCQSTGLISGKRALQTFKVLCRCERRKDEASVENGKVSLRLEVSARILKITIGVRTEEGSALLPTGCLTT